MWLTITLSVVFIMTVDNFVPAALLDAEALQQAADVLAAAAELSTPEDHPLVATAPDDRVSLRSLVAQVHLRTTRSMHNACMQWGARATAILNAVVLNRAFYSAGTVKCELLIHTLVRGCPPRCTHNTPTDTPLNTPHLCSTLVSHIRPTRARARSPSVRSTTVSRSPSACGPPSSSDRSSTRSSTQATYGNSGLSTRRRWLCGRCPHCSEKKTQRPSS